MEIYEICDPRFNKYGKIVDNVDFTGLVGELAKIPITDAVVYEPTVASLENGLSSYDRDTLFGGMEIQIGYCGGHNTKNTLIEFHKSSEVNVAATDAILYLGCIQDIGDDGCVNESALCGFRLPKGMGVELYSTTLHYAPCQLENTGFMVGIILPKGTNYPVEFSTDKDGYLAAVNKWLHKIV